MIIKPRCYTVRSRNPGKSYRRFTETLTITYWTTKLDETTVLISHTNTKTLYFLTSNCICKDHRNEIEALDPVVKDLISYKIMKLIKKQGWFTGCAIRNIVCAFTIIVVSLPWNSLAFFLSVLYFLTTHSSSHSSSTVSVGILAHSQVVSGFLEIQDGGACDASHVPQCYAQYVSNLTLSEAFCEVRDTSFLTFTLSTTFTPKRDVREGNTKGLVHGGRENFYGSGEKRPQGANTCGPQKSISRDSGTSHFSNAASWGTVSISFSSFFSSVANL